MYQVLLRVLEAFLFVVFIETVECHWGDVLSMCTEFHLNMYCHYDATKHCFRLFVVFYKRFIVVIYKVLFTYLLPLMPGVSHYGVLSVPLYC